VSPAEWQPAFLAVSVVLGEPIDAAAAALRDPGAGADPSLRPLLSGSRDSRARAVAAIVTSLVTSLDGGTSR
jgi:hypothetical protein